MTLDELTQQETAMDSFDELLNVKDYTPTILTWWSADRKRLADEYDKAQKHRGDNRRCWRGQNE